MSLKPISSFYSQLMKLRNRLYDSGVFRSEKISVPVISVGNITFGGTGKTPVVMQLCELLLKEGRKPLVVSRGYRRKSQQNLEVQLDGKVHNYGDEPYLIKSKFPEVKVFVGAKRAQVVKEAMDKYSVDLVIADDAFQHRSLQRDLDIVLIDATEDLKNYKVLPSGRLRESLSALQRADVLLLTKTNLVTAEQMQSLHKLLQSHIRSGCKVLTSEYLIKTEDLQKLSNYKSCILVSGVGNPQSVEKSLPSHLKVLQHLIYEDHHAYKDEDIVKINELHKKHGADIILTTEKDHVKLQKLANLSAHSIHTFGMELRIKTEEELREVLRSLFV